MTKTEKKNEGICVYCSNKAAKNNVRCKKHILYMHLVYLKKRKEKICSICCKPAYLNTTRCETHLKKANEYKYKTYHKDKELYMGKKKADSKKRKKDGKCLNCGILLNKEVDQGCVTCINCRLRLHKPKRWRYLNAINHENSTARL